MRYAIISDIHANLESLIAVLRAADAAQAQRVVCLGDLVGYYADPNGCVELIRQRGIECVRGNHDSVAAGLREPAGFPDAARRAIQWTRRHLSEENRAYLERLPLVRDIDDAFVAVHGALHPIPNDEVRIGGEAEAKCSLQKLVSGCGGRRVCFFGHTHQPAAYVMQEGVVTRLAEANLRLSDAAWYLINPGSVGQSRGADPRASMAVYDSVTRIVEFRRVEYDRVAAREKAMAMGLIARPHVLRRWARWVKGCLRTASALWAP